MNSFAAIQRYSTVKVHSGVEAASPHRLIQMLFEGALERIAQAKGALLQRNIARKGELIIKAIKITAGLQGSLNDVEGSSLTQDLDALYDYIIRQLTRANIENNADILDECTALLSEVKAGWDAIGPQATY